MINRPEMKMRAKASMKNAKPTIYIITLVLMAINYAISALSLKLNFPGLSIAEILEATYGGGDATALYYSMMNASGVGSMLDTLLSLMLGIVTIGFSLCCITISRSEKASVGMLFDPFAYFLKCIWLNILIGLKVMAWTLLFIVPGIIAAYRYRFAIYCFIDNPDMSASECIRESCEITNGHKGELFVLDLSFIGWSILTAIPFVSIFVMPYMETTNAHYYNELTNWTPDYTSGDSGTGDVCEVSEHCEVCEPSEDKTDDGYFDSSKEPWDQ